MSRALEKKNVATQLSGSTFKNQSHLNLIISEAQEIVGNPLGQF